jgi:flavin reductase (DIM6/NTAB) family NADH-FMN oxidoreductase RutF
VIYDASINDHGLKRDPFKALVVPRPIGWISSISKAGIVNLAPYSFFNAIGTDPHYVMFSSGGRKHSQSNIELTKEFVCSLATYDLREKMNQTSSPVADTVDEFQIAGLTPAPSRFVRPPRVAESPVALECVYHRTILLPGNNETAGEYSMVIGRVVGIYIDDDVIKDGKVQTSALRPIARLGYMDYSVVNETFELMRPVKPVEAETQ